MYVYSTVDAFSLFRRRRQCRYLLPGGRFAFSAVAASPMYARAPPDRRLRLLGFANCDTPTGEVLSDASQCRPSIKRPFSTLPIAHCSRSTRLGNPTEIVLALDTPWRRKCLWHRQSPQAPPPPATHHRQFGAMRQGQYCTMQFACDLPSVIRPNFLQGRIHQPRVRAISFRSSANWWTTKVSHHGRPRYSRGICRERGQWNYPSVPLVSSSQYPLAAAASTDGSQVFVAACDQYDPRQLQTTHCAVGSIHIVNTVRSAARRHSKFRTTQRRRRTYVQQRMQSQPRECPTWCNKRGNPDPGAAEKCGIENRSTCPCV